MNLRKLARGEPCLIRSPVCDGGGETTVLAHYRLAGYCGTGLKPPDHMGAFACARCHDLVDGRSKFHAPLSPTTLRLWHMEGVLRTVARLVELGAIKVAP